jgi:hypothetical protein
VLVSVIETRREHVAQLTRVDNANSFGAPHAFIFPRNSLFPSVWANANTFGTPIVQRRWHLTLTAVVNVNTFGHDHIGTLDDVVGGLLVNPTDALLIDNANDYLRIEN